MYGYILLAIYSDELYEVAKLYTLCVCHTVWWINCIIIFHWLDMQATWFMRWHNRFCCNMTACAVDMYPCQWFQSTVHSSNVLSDVLNNAWVCSINLSKGWAVEKAFFIATVHFSFATEQFIMNHDLGLNIWVVISTPSVLWEKGYSCRRHIACKV